MPAAAQTATATLFIEARDSAGAVLPGVDVRLVNQANAVERVATTTAAGTVAVPLLPAGTYSATASLPGFKKDVVNDLRLEAGGKGNLDLVLMAGSFEESIVVSADAGRLRTGDSTLGESFEGRLLVMMPVENRDFLQFTYQAPGAAPPAPGSRLSTQANAGVNVAGAREAANNFLLDGVDNNDLFLNRLVVTPSLDAIQEFTLVQNTYDAEYGRSTGAQVNVVMKSGGSRARGSLFEYFRDEALDARGVVRRARRAHAAVPAAPVRRHGRRADRPARAASISPASKASDAQRRDPRRPRAHRARAGGRFQRQRRRAARSAHRRPFPGNRIPADRLDPAGVSMAALYPDPNRAAAGQNFVSSPAGSRDGLQVTRQDRPPRLARDPVVPALQLHRDDRDQPFPARGRNLPGFGISVLDDGQNAAAGALAGAAARRLQRAAGRLEPAAARERAARARARRLRGAGHHGPPAAGGRHRVLRRSCWPATRRSATIRTCRCRGGRTPSTSATA